MTFILSSLEEAGVPVARRRFEAGETVYSRGASDRHLYFLTEGVVTLCFRREGLIEAQGKGRIDLLDEARLSELARSK